MTETELKETLADLLEYETAEERQKEKLRRSLRISKGIQKNESKAQIINSCRNLNHGAGYFSDVTCYDGNRYVCTPLLHSGIYIQYPRDSKRPSLLKKQTSTAVRRCREDIPLKGNSYRRLVDRWGYDDF